jgi:hypothetical protein
MRSVLVLCALVSCTGASSSSDLQAIGELGGACSRAADCPVNPAASCAAICPDGSNPCVSACVDGKCEPRGCPWPLAGAACESGVGCPPNPAATCVAICAPTNPCLPRCIDNVCMAQGCPP